MEVLLTKESATRGIKKKYFYEQDLLTDILVKKYSNAMDTFLWCLMAP